MRLSYQFSEITNETYESVKNVLPCLKMNPLELQRLADALDQKIFGCEKLFRLNDTDVWREKVSAENALLLI